MKYSFFIIFVLLSLIAVKLQAAEVHNTGEQSLLIFYSNNVAGETEPCG
jgi:hypothetical protein